MSTAREYIGTHYVESERPVWNEKDMLCLRGQLEKCPSTGRLHWQFYVKFKNAKRPKGAGNACSCEGAHMEPRKFKIKDGDMENYGLKSESSIEGTQFTFGDEEITQGTRTDLKSMCREILDGKCLADIAQEYPEQYVKYHNGIKSLKYLSFQKRNWIMDVRIYWGPPGSGKTSKVYKEFGIDNVFSKMENKWYDGYNGEECLLIDDFNPLDDWIKFKTLLKLTDSYPFTVETKNGTVNFCSKVIIFTCNEDPKNWFSWLTPKDKGAWDRRITKIEEIK